MQRDKHKKHEHHTDTYTDSHTFSSTYINIIFCFLRCSWIIHNLILGFIINVKTHYISFLNKIRPIVFIFSLWKEISNISEILLFTSTFNDTAYKHLWIMILLSSRVSFSTFLVKLWIYNAINVKITIMRRWRNAFKPPHSESVFIWVVSFISCTFNGKVFKTTNKLTTNEYILAKRNWALIEKDFCWRVLKM